MTGPSLGEQLREISDRLDAATTAWVAADYPMDGPVHDAREAVFADLRAWTAKATSR